MLNVLDLFAGTGENGGQGALGKGFLKITFVLHQSNQVGQFHFQPSIQKYNYLIVENGTMPPHISPFILTVQKNCSNFSHFQIAEGRGFVHQ